MGGEPSKTKLRALIDYKDEVGGTSIWLHERADPLQSWLGKPRFLLDGVIYKYTPGDEDHENWTKPKQVPSDLVVAHIEGCWMKEVKYRLKGEKVSAGSPNRLVTICCGRETLAMTGQTHD
jgi:hypothetical protein